MLESTKPDAGKELFELATLADLKEAVNIFNRDFPRPSIPPIQVSEPVVLESGYLQKLDGCSGSGVYILLTEKGQVLYIGKASGGRAIKHRLNKHLDRSGNLKPDKHKWPALPKLVAVIALPGGHAFEAPAIEEYLILKCGGIHQIGNIALRVTFAVAKFVNVQR